MASISTKNPLGSGVKRCAAIFLGFPAKGAFPYRQNAPASGLQHCIRHLITCAIAGDLVFPELWSGFWPSEILATMTVPKATVDEHCHTMASQDQIRGSG